MVFDVVCRLLSFSFPKSQDQARPISVGTHCRTQTLPSMVERNLGNGPILPTSQRPVKNAISLPANDICDRHRTPSKRVATEQNHRSWVAKTIPLPTRLIATHGWWTVRLWLCGGSVWFRRRRRGRIEATVVAMVRGQWRLGPQADANRQWC